MKDLSNAAGSSYICRFGGALFALFLFLAGSAFAQQSGVIRGSVTNEATGDLLPGAFVSVEGTNISTTTGREGRFSLTVPPGSHTLVVSYTGLDTGRIPVNVAAGSTEVADVGLTSEVYALEEFSISGIREGNALALQLQRNATNVKTVAATDTFGNPATNPGELIGRLPGITTDMVGGQVRQIQVRGMDRTFNSVMLDGNRVANAGSASYIREVQIEQMGTHNIERVEVIKAPTPDMDADAVAGFVNLVSKRAFDRPPGRRITANIGTIFKIREDNTSPNEDDPKFDLAAVSYTDVLSVLGGENNLGIAVNGLYRLGYTLSDQIDHAYRTTGAVEPDDRILQRTFTTREFIYPDYHYNGGINVDYRLSDDAYVYLRASGNKKDAYQRGIGGAWFGANNPNAYEPGWSYEYTAGLPVAANRFRIHSENFTKKAYNYTLSGGGEATINGGNGIVTYDLTQSYATTWYPDRNFLEANIRGVGLIMSRRDRDPMYPAIAQNGGPDIFDPANYELGPLTYFRNKSNHTVRGARLDYQHNFDTPVATYIKTGLRWAEERRVRDSFQARYEFLGADLIDGTADDESILPFHNPDYQYKQIGGRYGPWPALHITESGADGDIDRIRRSNPEQFDLDYYYTITNDLRNDAKINEEIQAGYIMGNIDFGKLRVLAGVRVEQTTVQGENFLRIVTAEERARRQAFTGPLTDEEEIRRAQAEFPSRQSGDEGEYRDVYPGVHFVYEPMEGLMFRASYNTSITRPAIGNLLPGFDVDELNQRVQIGNPNLRPFYSNNFEFGFEKYFEPVGLFGVGVFLKEITDYNRNLVTTVPEGPDNGFGGDFAGFELVQRINAGDARIRGIEANYQQQFSFLPGFWRGLGAFANFTYLEAEGTFGGNNFQRRLGGMTPRSGNAGISYINYGLQARALVNWRDRHYRSRSGFISQWRQERTIFDLRLQYTFNRNIDLFLDVTNLFDEPHRAEEYEFGQVLSEDKDGTTITAGLKSRF